MFYRFDDEITSVELAQLDSKVLTAGFVELRELSRIYKELGFPLCAVEKCRDAGNSFSCDIDVYDDFSFAKLILTDVKNMESPPDSLAVFVRKNFMLIVSLDDTDKSNRDYFMRVLSHCSCENITLERLLCAFLEGLIAGDNKELENAEYRINSLEEDVLRGNADNSFNFRLLKMKKELLALRGFYEQLIDVGDAFRENENELFDNNALHGFKIFTDKTIRLKENVDLLRDSVVHLWDSYQAYLDMKLNQTMKVFTLLTTIFFPLTVIVGWYGMNFKYMPEIGAKWGYPFVILLSVIVVGALIVWFKKKKWI